MVYTIFKYFVCAQTANMRHKKPQRSAIDRMTDSNFVRHRKLAGIIRVIGRKKVYTRCKHMARQIITDIIRPSVHLLQYSRKITLTPQIVLHVANSQNRQIYWTDDDDRVAVASFNTHFKTKKAVKEKEIVAAENPSS